ncbi:flagellar export chaperone FliS [Gallaecimonas xiamenensis]|uniref:Flagellar secretion chaperone FliS n=1 Tax=Gallaecimonas xiamenensis 3-C-1 TaxID=745411 RepID=K2KDQ4_9GAMM|nr:flagellar export chaperone FliS [Gallaecimonas xiamenensis]EKE75440.1 flagellar protein FliS [Gallaecimonas xiamenensis 3-C-1]
MRMNMKQYQGADRNARLLNANPHQVILMLMDGVLEKIAVAKGCLERNDIPGKSQAIDKAIGLISGLQGVLDTESAPEASKNFSAFYDVMTQGLIEASAGRDVEQLDHLIKLFLPLRDAWRDMPEAQKQEGLNLIQQKAASKSP